MPSSRAILDGLTRIAGELFGLAVAWHVVILIAIAALLAGYRPSQRVVARLMTLPLASVAIAAFAFGNPFNGAVFAGLTLALAVRAHGRAGAPAAAGPRWAVVIGLALIVFGAFYPHFLEGHAAWTYLVAAPFGLVPCPTLSLTIGSALVAGGFGDRAGCLILAVAGGFYALFGALRLGVWIDLALLAGALALVALVLRSPATLPSPPAVEAER